MKKCVSILVGVLAVIAAAAAVLVALDRFRQPVSYTHLTLPTTSRV